MSQLGVHPGKIGGVRLHLASRTEAGLDLPVLVWRFPVPLLVISSGPLGGGLGVRHWALNATVPMSYHRDDPDVHLAALADLLGLPPGPGAGLLTGVDVRAHVLTEDGGVRVAATVGLGTPAWAAAPDGDLRRGTRLPAAEGSGRVGTINVLAELPVRLSDAALVNAVATVAEAKAQALRELAVEGTGTCTDATCLAGPADGPAAPYGGPRSTWGARLARAVHAAVLTGGRTWLG